MTSVITLRWWVQTIAVICVVKAQRLLEHRVKSGLCSTDVNPLKNVCYMYDPTGKDQPTALAACEAKGGTLAALDTAETSYFVQSMISGSLRAWIGYNKDIGQWYDGSAFSWTNWNPGEPNLVEERCVIILFSHGFTFGDNRCEHVYPSICQLPETDTQARAIEEEPKAGIVSLPRSEHSAESKFRCGQYCLQDPLCGKFNFHPTTLKCALYDVGAVVDEADGSQTFTF